MKENRIIASGLITALAAVAMAAVTLTFSSCGKARQSAGTETLADSLIKAAIHAQNIDRLVAVCDSLQLTGDISLFQAAYHRGVAYIEIDKMRPAENELKRAMAEVPQHHQDSIFYYQCVSRLVEVQAKRADYEGALHTALPVIEKLKREAEKESSRFPQQNEHKGWP